MWYRVIKNDVNEEIDILKRRTLSNAKGRRFKDYVRPKDVRCKTFTRLSAFQFIENGKSQDFFCGRAPGVKLGIVLFDDAEREVYWRNSSRAVVSDAAFATIKETEAEFASSLRELNFIKVTEAEASSKFSEMWETGMLDHNRFLEGMEVKYEELPFSMAWTEGLFRYQVEDVKFVVCCQDNLPEANKFIQLLRENGGKPEGLVFEL